LFQRMPLLNIKIAKGLYPRMCLLLVPSTCDSAIFRVVGREVQLMDRYLKMLDVIILLSHLESTTWQMQASLHVTRFSYHIVVFATISKNGLGAELIC
jgi:hypothetical protein